MKRWLLIILALLTVLVILTFVLIPSTIRISSVGTARCSKHELTTCVHEPAKWLHWVPDSSANVSSVLQHQRFTAAGYTYTLQEKLLNGAAFQLQHDGLSLPVRIEALSLSPDSVAVQMETSFAASSNPITRVTQYFQAVSVKKNLDDLMHRLLAAAVQPALVYGFPIVRGSFDDTLLISTRVTLPTYPDVSRLYQEIDGIRLYLLQQKVQAADAPMFHVLEVDSSHYELMVAIAINRPVPETAQYHLIRMVHINGKYVQTEVKGGPETVKEAHRQIESFMLDHSLTSPGLPFEILVTDRRAEGDTGKWVTKVFHPST